MTIFEKRFGVVLAVILFAAVLPAQSRVKDRIARAITGSEFTALPGNVHPMARPEYDHGRVEDSFALNHITLVFKPSAAGQSDLKTLLAQLQDPSSPEYHHFLTPEQFASRFGMSQNDVNKVTAWLESQGFRVQSVARSRMWIVFSGNAGQVDSAFRTEIHHYVVNGEAHYANASQPSLPGAMASVALGFRGLNNFRPKPRAVVRRVAAKPRFTSSITGNHFLTPNDFATIYDVAALYNAGLDGTGQKIAVMGQTDLAPKSQPNQFIDIEHFRTSAGLPANDPTVVLIPGSPDPGLSQDDIEEADLDVEWAGAVAPAATIIYVNSGTANGAFDSLQYAINQNLAPVAVITYGNCESQWGAAGLQSLESQVQQANAQGMTVVAPSGDEGAADCDSPPNSTTVVTTATQGISVDAPASLPEVTGVGGTEFNEGSGAYWGATNNSQNGSALSYIPEEAWNDTNSTNGLSASGGGASAFFAKPSWQTGAGVPNDNARDVPDISLDASPGHDAYLVCSEEPSGQPADCTNGFRDSQTNLDVVGGTSAGAPVFGAILALINQETHSAEGQGNINYILYPLVAQDPTAFHDITSGSNVVPCSAGTADCPASGSYGFNTGPGYDQVTGLGTPDVANLVSEWTRFSPVIGSSPDFQLFVNPGSLTLSSSTTPSATITVTAINGFAQPVNFSCTVPTALQATCSMNPSSVNLTSSATSATATLKLASTRSSALFPVSQKPGRWPKGVPVSLSLILIVFSVLIVATVTLGRRSGVDRFPTRYPSPPRWAAVFAAVVCVAVLMVSCGGGGSTPGNSAAPPPTLTGNIVVQATSGSLSHSIQVSVTQN